MPYTDEWCCHELKYLLLRFKTTIAAKNKKLIQNFES